MKIKIVSKPLRGDSTTHEIDLSPLAQPFGEAGTTLQTKAISAKKFLVGHDAALLSQVILNSLGAVLIDISRALMDPEKNLLDGKWPDDGHGPDCPRGCRACSGEWCNIHGVEPCQCNQSDRHKGDTP